MVHLTIKENCKQAKTMIEFLKTLPYVIIHEEKKTNAVTLKAIKDVKAGKVTKAKNKKDFFEKLNKTINIVRTGTHSDLF